jgi:hypothetical protein
MEETVGPGGNYFEGDGGRWALRWVLWFLHCQSGIFLSEARVYGRSLLGY